MVYGRRRDLRSAEQIRALKLCVDVAHQRVADGQQLVGRRIALILGHLGSASRHRRRLGRCQLIHHVGEHVVGQAEPVRRGVSGALVGVQAIELRVLGDGCRSAQRIVAQLAETQSG